MRLKITQELRGSIDGLHLDRFRVGEIYDIGTSIANYLLAIGAAEPVTGERPAHVVPLQPHELLDELRRRLSGRPPASRTEAADRKHRRTKKR